MNGLEQIEQAAAVIYRYMPPTPQYSWPLLCARSGVEVWVKHENHTPIGSFKLRGGLYYLDELKKRHPTMSGVIAATRGNHGQSVALAARRHDMQAIIVTPHGNSVEKNRAMRAFGAELVEYGNDFEEAKAYASERAAGEGIHMVPSYDPMLGRGVATYGLEFFGHVKGLDVVYVPIGLGSGIVGTIMARDALGLGTKIVGVVAEQADCYAKSFVAGKVVETASAVTMADGVAVRVPDQEALAVIRAGAERVVKVSEEEIQAAMVAYYTDTHNVAEGAGAAPLAALLKERETLEGQRAGIVLTGGNVDGVVFRDVLAGVAD